MQPTDDQEQLLHLLEQLDIRFQRFDHPAVFTCEESDRLCQPMPGAHTKQLFMRDKKKRQYVLAIVMHDKHVDVRAFSEQLGIARMSFASPPDLMSFLHIEPGSVTPFGLMFDTGHRIRVIIDADARAIGSYLFHPLMNTATLAIDHAGFEKFLQATGHAYEVVSIPQIVGR